MITKTKVSPQWTAEERMLLISRIADEGKRARFDFFNYFDLIEAAATMNSGFLENNRKRFAEFLE